MPELPKSRKSKTISSRKPQTGRKVQNPFYHTKAWRNFRAQQKAEAIEETKKIMLNLTKQEKPIPLIFARLQPLCAECLKGTATISPRYSVARILDHKQPINPRDAYETIRGRYGEPLSKENVQWLCEPHHARKSGAEHSFHKKQSI